MLTISGEHDLSTAPNLRRRLDGLIDERVSTVVDLSPATFIDSSILGVILDGRRRATEAKLGFAVACSNGSGAVDRVLDVTGLRSELPVHARREDAVTAASGNSGKSPP
ncbi:MAG TPA: STAS domain-containing protein [Solirubrobacterales bacterium]|nr:STAS domain-containing protein [Solirubrobacterales bacterium]